LTVPSFGESLEFFKASYKVQWFRPVYEDFIFSLKGDVGYGDGFGDDALPFFENYYAGGPRSVRGYEENTLGPLDSRGRPLGGNIKIVGGAELIIPVPFLREFESVRLAGFLDGGNVWGTNFITGSTDFDISEMRFSVGLSVIWVSPFGLVSVSISKPFGDEPGDQTQSFQFNFGSSF